MHIAITRDVSPKIGCCELTHLKRETIDLEVATTQHRQYERALAELGCEVHCLPAEPNLPDSVFVEDTAIVLDDVVVMMRPGAKSRRPEISSIAKALEPYRKLLYIEPPGTLDGGDVLAIDKTLFVGLSSRSNRAGIEQLRRLLKPFNYEVMDVKVKGCLHLKSAATRVSDDVVLINRDWAEASAFAQLNLIDVAPSEPFGGNALLIGKTVIYSSAFPETQKRLEDCNIDAKVIDVTELAKAEGGVTCCSLIFSA